MTPRSPFMWRNWTWPIEWLRLLLPSNKDSASWPAGTILVRLPKTIPDVLLGDRVLCAARVVKYA